MQRNSTFEIDQMVPMSETSQSSGFDYANRGQKSLHGKNKDGLPMKTATDTIQRYSAASIEAMQN